MPPQAPPILLPPHHSRRPLIALLLSSLVIAAVVGGVYYWHVERNQSPSASTNNPGAYTKAALQLRESTTRFSGAVQGITIPSATAGVYIFTVEGTLPDLASASTNSSGKGIVFEKTVPVTIQIEVNKNTKLLFGADPSSIKPGDHVRAESAGSVFGVEAFAATTFANIIQNP